MREFLQLREVFFTVVKCTYKFDIEFLSMCLNHFTDKTSQVHENSDGSETLILINTGILTLVDTLTC